LEPVPVLVLVLVLPLEQVLVLPPLQLQEPLTQ
jgi:hypothetical protein